MQRIIDKGATALHRLFDTNQPERHVIPDFVLKEAEGIVYLSIVTIGCGVTCRVGKGFVMTRTCLGKWGPPSALRLRGLGLGAGLGGEALDCVIVLNTKASVASFFGSQVMMGSELDLVFGPRGISRASNRTSNKQSTASKKHRKNYTYVYARGLYGGLGIHGDVVYSCAELNRKFYGLNIESSSIVDHEACYTRASTIMKLMNHLTDHRFCALFTCFGCGEKNSSNERLCTRCETPVIYSRRIAGRSLFQQSSRY